MIIHLSIRFWYVVGAMLLWFCLLYCVCVFFSSASKNRHSFTNASSHICIPIMNGLKVHPTQCRSSTPLFIMMCANYKIVWTSHIFCFLFFFSADIVVIIIFINFFFLFIAFRFRSSANVLFLVAPQCSIHNQFIAWHRQHQQ